MVFSYKDGGKDGCMYIMGAVPCEYDKGSKKEISDMDVEPLPLEEVNKRDSLNNTVGALSLDEDTQKAYIYKTVGALPTEDDNKACIDNNVYSLHTEEESK